MIKTVKLNQVRVGGRVVRPKIGDRGWSLYGRNGGKSLDGGMTGLVVGWMNRFYMQEVSKSGQRSDGVFFMQEK